MSRPSESPQITFRENTSTPKFAGLTLPPALRELCAQPGSETPRSSEMSALATRLRKIQLDISPSGKGSKQRNVLNPSRLDFDGDEDNDDGVDKENIGKKNHHIGTAVRGAREGHISGKLGIGETEPLEAKVDSNEVVEENIAKSSVDSSQPTDKAQFMSNLQKILDGKNKWPWLERCKAMSSAAESLAENPALELVEHTRSVLKPLTSKLNDHLDELRPSVITSALGLVNAIVSLKLDGGFDFAEEVFPIIMDLACGRSLTSQEAAKSLALVLQHHSGLQPVLSEADNIDRLCDILQQQANSLSDVGFRERAILTLEMAQKVAARSEARSSRNCSPEQDTGQSSSKSPSLKADDPMQLSAFDGETSSRLESPKPRTPSFRGRLPGQSPALSAQNSARSLYRSSVGLSRTHIRDETSPGSSSSAPHVGNASVEVRNGATVIKNTKLLGSVRKLSPGSMRTQRKYSDEELEEVRRRATQTAMDDAIKTHEKEKEALLETRENLERRLKEETAQVLELKGVLEEYQLTMQTMVARGNTHVSAQNTALVNEKNKLKAELLELSESFETLKEKYDDSKKTISLFEAKENRFIEQIKELKKNMVDLQKWSNDLKANTEKKLSKAFESVTSHRAAYIDKEAHAKKAISDLERTKTELEREQQSHAETAAKFSQVEAQLHNEQDARSSAEASLATMKTALSRITSQKDRLQNELDGTKESLSETKTKLFELERSVSRVSDLQNQLDDVTIENQSLKARAYDDMAQIQSLEATVKEKDAELEEMSTICEEAMERLERGKLGTT